MKKPKAFFARAIEWARQAISLPKFSWARAPVYAIRAAIVGIALATLGLAFAWSGAYSVAASTGHFIVVEWLLRFGMENSVDTNSFNIKGQAPQDDPNQVALGAAHFHGGCAYCHGAPGILISPIAERMLPPPPPLGDASKTWKDRELFWLVKNGIKYTGMPGWPAQQRDDEVWAVVAFLKKLPGLDENGYRELALGGLTLPPSTGREIATKETSSDAVGACARCHGAEGKGPRSNLVPLLHGQPAEFIAAALQAYRDNRRPSGIMQPIAADLTPDAMKLVVDYYSKLSLPASPGAADPQAAQRGGVLAAQGDGAALIPPCASCHDDKALSAFPRLAGQSAPYIVNRLRLWRDGISAQTETDAIMAPIAKRLTDAQIADVAAYFSAMTAAGAAKSSAR